VVSGWQPLAAADVDAQVESHYRAFYPDLLAYLTTLTRNRADAEEIAGEAFVRAMIAWRRDGLPPAPMPWLVLTARRISADKWRKASRMARRMVSLRVAQPIQPDEAIEAIDWFVGLGKHLTKRQREVLILRYVGTMTDREIGSALGLSDSGVRSLASRAIEALRQHTEDWQ
jgi:RNA polymerase sigma-70 factor (ECF subfamily)